MSAQQYGSSWWVVDCDADGCTGCVAGLGLLMLDPLPGHPVDVDRHVTAQMPAPGTPLMRCAEAIAAGERGDPFMAPHAAWLVTSAPSSPA